MELKINGKDKSVPDALNVSGLLGACGVEKPEMVSVELNGEILSRESFNETMLKNNDTVEFLYFMGGGTN
jgi:sulfur carrier protein